MTQRARIETLLRAAHAGARNETEFIVNAQSLGLLLQPRIGREDFVFSYKAKLAGEIPGMKLRWFSAGMVARDLDLNRMRPRWDDSPSQRTEARPVWDEAWKTRGFMAGKGAHTQADWEARTQGLDDFLTRLQYTDPSNPAAVADATQDLAGLFAAASQSRALTPGTRAALGDMARSLGRHAQLKNRPSSPNKVDPNLQLAAGMLTTAMRPEGSLATMFLAKATAELSIALAQLYAQTRQFNTAAQVLHDTIGHWNQIHQGTSAEVNIDPGAAAVAVAERPENRGQRIRRITQTLTGTLPSSPASQVGQENGRDDDERFERVSRILSTFSSTTTRPSASPVRPPKPNGTPQQADPSKQSLQ